MARDAPGWTPLHKAARVGHNNAVHALIEAGASIEARASISGRTPLHEACAYLKPDLVNQLLLLGADENALDTDSQTPHDVVGQWMVPGENVQGQEMVRAMLKGAPAARRWRRRSLMLLLLWRLFPPVVAGEQPRGVGGVTLPPSAPDAMVCNGRDEEPANGAGLPRSQQESEPWWAPTNSTGEHEEGGCAKDGGDVFPLSPQLTNGNTSEKDASQRQEEDVLFLISSTLGLPEGIFRTVILFL